MVFSVEMILRLVILMSGCWVARGGGKRMWLRLMRTGAGSLPALIWRTSRSVLFVNGVTDGMSSLRTRQASGMLSNLEREISTSYANVERA